MRSLACVLPLVTALVACGPLPVKTKVRPFEYQGWAGTLPSGLRFVAYELPHMRRVMVAVSYRVGSADDPAGREGMAHLVEHLTYRSRPGGGPRLWDRVWESGDEFNGETGPDSTDYYELGRVEDLDRLLALEADRLRDPLAGVTEQDFVRERDVVLHELALRKDPASQLTQLEWLRERALPAGSPYARSATTASIRSITFEEVRAFVRTHYTPARAILVVNGPTSGASLERRITLALGTLAGDPARRIAPVPQTPPSIDLNGKVNGDITVRSAPIDRPVLWVAWTVPGDHDGGAPRAIAATDFLSDTLVWAIAGADLVDDVVSFDTFESRSAGVSLVVGRVELRNAKDGPRLLVALKKERKFQARGIGPDRMFTPETRDNLLMAGHLALESLEVPAIAHHWRATGDPDFVRGWQRLVAKELSTDTKEYVGKYLRADRLVALLVTPNEEPSPVPPIRVDGHATSPHDHHGAREVTATPPGDLRLSPPSELELATRRTLSNGLPVVVVRRPGFRVLETRLVIPTEPGGDRNLLFRRFALRSSTCSGVPSTLDDGLVTFPLDGPSDLADRILKIVACRTRPLRVNGFSFDRSRDHFAKHLERNPPSLRERAGAAFFSELFRGDPRTAPVSPADVKSYVSRDVEPWLEATIRPDRAVLTIVGDVEADEAFFAQLEELFGKWRANGAAAPLDGSAGAPTRRIAVIADRPGWPTAEVNVAFRTPMPGARDAAAHDVLLAALEEHLNGELRIAEGRTYGVWLGTTDRRMGSFANVSTVVDTSDAALAVTRILGAVERVARTPLRGDVFARARWRAAREFDASFSTAARTSERLEQALAFGTGVDGLLAYPASLVALDPERVITAAKRLAIGREVILVLGDARTIAPQLTRAGVEEVRIVSSEPVRAAR